MTHIPLTHRVGRRGAFLCFLALLDIIYGYSMLFPTTRSLSTPTSQFIMHVAPLWAWGSLWLTTGVVCAIYAFREKDAPGYAAAMFIKILWGLTFLLGWIFVDVERGYLSSAIWLAFAAVVALIASWPEPRHRNGDEGWMHP